MLAKFRLPEVVAMETVPDSFLFNDRYLSRGLSYFLKFCQCVLLHQRYILCSEHDFVRPTEF